MPDLNGVFERVFDQGNGALRVSGGGSMAADATAGPYNMPTDGTTDGSVALQAAIDAVGLAGGGTVSLPQHTYVIQNVYITANVMLLVAPGTIFKLPTVPAMYAQCFTLGTKLWTDASWAKNCGIVGGPYTFDYTGQAAGKLIRGIEVANAQQFRVEGARGVAIPDGNVVHLAMNAGDYGPDGGIVQGIRAESAPFGYGAIQMTGGQGVDFANLTTDGGVALRLEPDATHGLSVENITARNLSASGGANANAAVMLAAHARTLRNIRIEGVRAAGGAHGASRSTEPGGLIDDTVIDTMTVGGGGSLWKTAGNDQSFPGIALRNAHVIGATGRGVECAGETYENVVAESCGGVGWWDIFRTGGYDSTVRNRLARCKSLKNAVYGGQFLYSDAHLIDCELNDNPAILTPTTAQMLGATQKDGTLAGWSAGSGASGVSGAGGVLTVTAGNASPTEILARTATGASGVAVVAAHYYKFSFAGALGTAPGTTCRASIWWYKSDGTLIAADNGGTIVTLPTTAIYWAQAPALAAFATVVVKFQHTSAMTSGWTFTAGALTLAEMPGLATQNYGLNLGTGVTASLVLCDLASNAVGASTGAGTVLTATFA